MCRLLSVIEHESAMCARVQASHTQSRQCGKHSLVSCNMYIICGGRLRERDFWVKQIYFDLNHEQKRKVNPSPSLARLNVATATAHPRLGDEGRERLP